MQLYDAAVYDRWVDVTQGRVGDLAHVIPAEFGAEYILTDLQHGEFLRQARRDPGLEEIYRDSYAAVFRLAPKQEDLELHVGNRPAPGLHRPAPETNEPLLPVSHHLQPSTIFR